MNSKEIEHNVKVIFEDYQKDEFIFDLLMAYGISKTSITRLKKGDFNLSKVEGEILYKKKVFFKEEKKGKLLSSIEAIAKEQRILKHQPRFAILTDYETLVAKDLKLGKNLDVKLKELPKYFDFFLPLARSEVYNAPNDHEADRNASYKMASLYDLLIEANPNTYNSQKSVHNLNMFLSRLLFCFFAEDTGIFEEESIFTNTLEQHTAKSGDDTHTFLDKLFDRLNTKDASKYPAYLAKFPYVNGGLFRDRIKSPKFTGKPRKMLLELGGLQWKHINPDIFGSMIQAVVIPEYRSDLGMHYTSVPNILKLIKPLFLDELYEEFEDAITIKQLRKLISRMSKVKFFDPACGSGNFLIIAYKEVRLLEILILQKIMDLSPNPEIVFTQIQLSQFYGIELDDFAHEMAILSLWLAEHQMNRVFEEMLFDYGKSKPILPLKQAGQIQQGNATRVDWKKICPIDLADEVYVIGNPPYLGSSLQDASQKQDLAIVFLGHRSYKNLDYIACWFKKGADYISGMNAKCAFVSTNSICQGEQVEMLWPVILGSIEIFFAYPTFKWTNNAKGNAGVSVIIVGLRNFDNSEYKIFTGNHVRYVKSLNPYLIEGENIIISKRSQPISKNIEPMSYGSKPVDDGHLILTNQEKNDILGKNKNLEKYIKRFVGSNELLNGIIRWCFWITDDELNKAVSHIEIADRIGRVKKFRLKSKKAATRESAATAHAFGERRYSNHNSIIIPSVSSERREHLPVDFFDENIVISNSAHCVLNATPLTFAILSSKIHLCWLKTVAGRLENRLRYSSSICYNTFPFPEISLKQKENLSLYVFTVLDERAKHPSKSMAQLYNPDTMPKGLKKAHEELDDAIERCYRLQPFKNDTERLEYLFKMYEEMVKKNTLFAKQKKTRKKAKAK